MKFKTIAGLGGLLMLVGFLAPPVIKLKSIALAVVVLIGVTMAAWEYIEYLRHKDD